MGGTSCIKYKVKCFIVITDLDNFALRDVDSRVLCFMMNSFVESISDMKGVLMSA